MPNVRIGLAQVNPTVGDLEGNADIVRDIARRAAGDGVQLLALPEMALTGYPVEDLALRPSFQRASEAALRTLARQLAADGHADLVTVIGYLGTSDDGSAPMNALAVVHDGEIKGRYVKHHLPNYGVFDEARHFRAGTEPLHVRLDDTTTVTLAICEDLWRDGGPVEWAKDAESALLLVINASPYEMHKDDSRLELCRQRAQQSGSTLAYVNMVGGQDELVFDGDSMVVASDGTLLARSPQFVDDLLVLDLDLPSTPLPAAPSIALPLAPHAMTPLGPDAAAIATPLSDLAETYQALVLGLRDYVEKNRFRSVLLGLSGGIDSALVAALACDAIGADRVFGVSMPSVYSSQHSRDDAADLAQRCGLHYRTVAIAPMVDAFQSTLQLSGLAEENLQARIRGTTLMGISNAEGHLVLTTGNKSELSVGYSTMYGDSVGGFAPIKDVPKVMVWELSRWRNEHATRLGAVPPIPESSITKEPSAELRPDQKDSDSLPDYAELDAVLEGYVARAQGARALVDAGFDPALVERVLRLTDLAEYKRRQYPPGTKVSGIAFGRDRRLPITNRWRELTG